MNLRKVSVENREFFISHRKKHKSLNFTVSVYGKSPENVRRNSLVPSAPKMQIITVNRMK